MRCTWQLLFMLNTGCVDKFLLPRGSSASLPHLFRDAEIPAFTWIREIHGIIRWKAVNPSPECTPYWDLTLQIRLWPWISSAFTSAGLSRIIQVFLILYICQMTMRSYEWWDESLPQGSSASLPRVFRTSSAMQGKLKFWKWGNIIYRTRPQNALSGYFIDHQINISPSLYIQLYNPGIAWTA